MHIRRVRLPLAVAVLAGAAAISGAAYAVPGPEANRAALCAVLMDLEPGTMDCVGAAAADQLRPEG